MTIKLIVVLTMSKGIELITQHHSRALGCNFMHRYQITRKLF